MPRKSEENDDRKEEHRYPERLEQPFAHDVPPATLLSRGAHHTVGSGFSRIQSLIKPEF